MSSIIGEKFVVSIFGQSHGKAIGAVVDGLPAGIEIDFDKLKAFVKRRAPGNSILSTQRKEADSFDILSGIHMDTTTGFPVAFSIRNSDQRSKDYSNLRAVPRPNHADFTAFVKYGESVDMRGGGHFSGRLTAPICVAGGMAMQVLEKYGISIGAHISSIKDVYDESFDYVLVDKQTLEEVSSKEFSVINDEIGDRMKKVIDDARLAEDSVGGIIECAVIGLPVGVGNPMFDGLENIIAKAMFGIPAVRGIEFGLGFESTKLMGSENNDAFEYVDGKVVTKTNRSGGIQGGISNAMPVVFKVAFKPTASISIEQESVNLQTGENEKLVVRGRHDPCITVRAVPVVEAMCAIAVLDALMIDGVIK